MGTKKEVSFIESFLTELREGTERERLENELVRPGLNYIFDVLSEQLYRPLVPLLTALTLLYLLIIVLLLVIIFMLWQQKKVKTS